MPGSSPEMGGYQGREVSLVAAERTPMPETEVRPRLPEHQEAQPAPSEPAIVVPVAPAQPLLPAPVAAAQTTVQPQPANTNPIVANDADLIEKEWVDRAKRIVQQTKDDPYSQEKEVSRLQADYVKRRYDKDIKLSSE